MLSIKGIMLLISFIGFSAACSVAPRVIEKNESTPGIASVPSKTINYSTIWEALINLDMEAALEFHPDPEQTMLINALDLVLERKFDSAEVILQDLIKKTNDPFLKKKSERVLIDLMFFRSGWNDIIAWDEADIGQKYRYDNDNMLIVDAFATCRPQEIKFSDNPKKARLYFSPSGSPIVEVYINGVKKFLWLDTGANYTFISMQTVKECNIKKLGKEKSKAITPSIRQISVYPGVIDSISFGGVTVYNHPIEIVNDLDMKFRFFIGGEITHIDGLIGWKLIQNLDLEIDYAGSTYTVRKPEKRQGSSNNLFWIGCPVVRLISPDGIILNFGLDTGADRTTITDNILKKVDIDKLYNIVGKYGTIGGWTYNNSLIIPEITLNLDGKDVLFNYLGTSYQFDTFFIRLDGSLGSDICRRGSVRIDWLNGEFSFTPAKD